MSKADELWERQAGVADEGVMLVAMTRQSFLAALHEYGAMVRARDAEIIESLAVHRHGYDKYGHATAISKEPLP